MKHLTYAELGEKIAKKIGKFETDLKSTEPDVRATAERGMPKLKQAMLALRDSNQKSKAIAEAEETRNILANGGYMNGYAGGGNLPMGDGGLDIGGIGDIVSSFSGGSDAGGGGGGGDWWMGQGVEGADINAGGMDWGALLKTGMGLLGGLKKSSKLNEEVVPTEKYNAVYNHGEKAALENLNQMQNQANEGYRQSQQDTHIDTKGQRMANEQNRIRAQKIANVGGPEGFVLQSNSNNKAKDTAMLIEDKRALQEAVMNSASEKAKRGAQFTNMLGNIGDKKMKYGNERVKQDAIEQDQIRRDWAAARGTNNQTDADWLENDQLSTLMQNQQGIDAGTVQSIMDIFSNQSAKDAIGG